jgi:hypothetical protein
MLTDHELRAALSKRVAHLAPDVEAELDALLRRANRRRHVRATAYGVGVAAAVATAVLVVTQGLRPVEKPEPVEETPVQTLAPELGTLEDPEPIEPGRWRVGFQDASTPRLLEVDVPPGWGQDDDVSLSTGAPSAPAARRLDLAGDMVGVYRDPCRSSSSPVGDTALEQAQALASMHRVHTSAVTPAVVDGHPAYHVRLDIPAGLRGKGESWCAEGMALVIRTTNWPTVVPLGWTARVWIIEYGRQELAITATYGPEATPAQIEELLHMVETATIVDP